MKNRKIIIKYGEVRNIARLLKVTEQTVINAINFKYNSDLSSKIRQIAIKRGGMLMEEV